MRIVILADNTLAAEAIRRGLRHAPSCQVLGYINRRHAFEDALRDTDADLVVVDDGGDEELLDAIGVARATLPDAKLVLLTMRMDPAWLGQTATAGIDAAISKSAQPASIGMLVREIVAGNVFHAFTPVPAVPTRLPAAASSLTARELEILRHVAAGRSNAQIAAHLWVTEQTVKFHLSNTYRKLGVSNRTEASHYAYLNRLLEPSQVPSRIAVAA